jgi:hypothetical protein
MITSGVLYYIDGIREAKRAARDVLLVIFTLGLRPPPSAAPLAKKNE